MRYLLEIFHPAQLALMVFLLISMPTALFFAIRDINKPAKVTFQDLGNGQVFVDVDKIDPKTLISEIARKYGSNYRIITTNSTQSGVMRSVVIEVL